ncbi:MAG: hypothetical protein ACI4PJ_02990 [Acutalibacteraceae bacterium]
MSKKTEDKIIQFKNFIEDQTAKKTDSCPYKQTDSCPYEQNNAYSYSDSRTIINRFRNLFSGSKSRLKNTFLEFVKTKKGTCWELAMSYDYYLFKTNKPNHHIVAVKTGSITCHTFNIYVDNTNDNTKQLHIIDLYQRFKDQAIKNYGEFDAILKQMFDPKYTTWYVLSEVKNNFSEKFKRLGMKKWAKFSGETANDGGFMIINKGENVFMPNEKSKVKWTFSPFKFPTFG